MAKTDSPPFRMIVEKGPRLAPATASDAERLDTWRVGSAVNIAFVRNGSRVMERKWWAVLGLVVGQCNVPWKTKEQASEAVKLALGIVNLTKTVGGAWMQYPKSLTELDDPELDAAVRDMMDLIQKMTGIDPDTLRKEAADVGTDEHEHEQPDAPSPASGSGGGEVIPNDAAPDNSESAAADPSPEEAAPPTESSGDDNSIDLVTRNLMVEALDKFIALATDANVPDPKDRRGVLATAKDAWKDALPQRLDFVKTCFETADKVIKGELKPAVARKYLEGLLP